MSDAEPTTNPERTNERTNRSLYPAAERVAKAIVAVVDATNDPRNAEAWGRLAVASPGALRDWCRAAGLGCHDALGFARMLRAGFLALAEGTRDGAPVSLGLFIDIVDERYRARYIQRAGVSAERQFSLDDYLQRQQFLDNKPVIDAVRLLLSARTLSDSRSSSE